MSKKHIYIDFKAEYQVSGTEDTSNLILAFHGYGQLAKYFIKKFDSLSSNSRIVAPQGLSRFYLDGFYGRVGATWMTKEEREVDIENYLNYINQVCEEELKLTDSNTNIHLIGFSQGAATATRFAMNTNTKISSLTLWAGIFPPDLNFPKAKSKFESIPVSIVLGKKDPYIEEGRINEMKDLIEKIGIEPEILWYDGDHTIDIETLKILKEKLDL